MLFRSLGVLEEVVRVDGPSAQGIASVVDEALKGLGGKALDVYMRQA